MGLVTRVATTGISIPLSQPISANKVKQNVVVVEGLESPI
jgi:hypothetical protein